MTDNIVEIKKLIITKNGHHFRTVKKFGPVGMFVVNFEKETHIFNNKKKIVYVDEMFDCIESWRLEWVRDKKIEKVLENNI
jgi:hypothetical protein